MKEEEENLRFMISKGNSITYCKLPQRFLTVAKNQILKRKQYCKRLLNLKTIILVKYYYFNTIINLKI